MAMTLYATNFYNNSGTKIIWQGCLENALTIVLTDYGATISCGDKFSGEWGYQGSGTFLGLATSAGASIPTYNIGDTITTALSTLNLYIVESGGGSEKVLKVKYNNNYLINTGVGSNLNKTLKCQDKVMSSNIEITLT